MTNPIEEIRAKALAELAANEPAPYVPDPAIVTEIVDKAIKEISDLVRRFPKKKHYRDFILGGISFSADEQSDWMAACTIELRNKGYSPGILIERYSFSNQGDPCYMGPAEMIVQKGIRFVG